MLYAEAPRYRIHQIVLDVAVLGWVVAWSLVGIVIHDLVERLAGPARAVEGAGRSFAGPFTDAGRSVADLPVVGEPLAGAFERAAGAGRSLAAAGVAQQDAVHTLALWLGLAIALIPVALLLLRYAPARRAWIVEASAARRLRREDAGLALFALRAVANRSLHELRRATPDPAGALARGDHTALARLELSALGLDVEPR